jgi:hypothetical protein
MSFAPYAGLQLRIRRWSRFPTAAALVLGLGLFADPKPLSLAVAAALIGSGILRIVKPRSHPRCTMRVSRSELTWWSFLMSSAHGAGLGP